MTKILSRGWWVVAVLLPWAACSPKETGPAPVEALETVDLATGPDFAPDDDPRAAPRQGQLAGILPEGFPRDLPLHLPASVDGFSVSSAGQTVELTTSASPAEVRDALAKALRTRGWRGAVAIGTSSLAKDGKTVQLTIAAGTFGSRYAYRY